MTHMRLANHYVIRDLSRALDTEDAREIHRIFRKYSHRFRLDPDLSRIACMVLACVSVSGSRNLQELKKKLQQLCDARRFESVRGRASLFPTRITSFR